MGFTIISFKNRVLLTPQNLCIASYDYAGISGYLYKTETMEKLEYDVLINAPREKVWGILWDDATYRAWTAVFSPGSHAKTDWQEGSKVLFLDSSGKGGMVSEIAANRKPEYMSFKHMGEVRDGVEDTESEAVQKWQGSHENYTLNDVDGKTHLIMDMDMVGDNKYLDYFKETWPKALAKVKELSEA